MGTNLPSAKFHTTNPIQKIYIFLPEMDKYKLAPFLDQPIQIEPHEWTNTSFIYVIFNLKTKDLYVCETTNLKNFLQMNYEPPDTANTPSPNQGRNKHPFTLAEKIRRG